MSAGPGWTGATGRPTRIVLARHGQTALSVDRRYSGQGDPELTDLGQAQAERTARRLAALPDLAAVVSSPLRRCLGTAERAAEAAGVPLIVDDDLIETDFGVWEGLEFDEVHRRWPTEHADWAADPSVSAVGGESMDAVAARCGRLIGSLERSGGDGGTWQGRTVLLVSHVSPIKAILRTALEAPATVYSTLHLDLAGLSVAEFYPDRSVVREVNDTHYLQGL